MPMSEAELEPICREIIGAHPQQVERFKAGKTMMGFLVGQVLMRCNDADPRLVRGIFERLLPPPERPRRRREYTQEDAQLDRLDGIRNGDFED